MGINAEQLRRHVIQPTLRQMGYDSEAAQNLLLLTAAVESDMGSYLAQWNGPALGIYQMEPDTYNDIWENFLHYRTGSNLYLDVQMFRMYSLEFDEEIPGLEDEKSMIGNLYYATAMARVHYLRVPEKLPEANDIEGLASYWKRYWNTDLGAGTVEIAVEKYNKYVNNVPWSLP